MLYMDIPKACRNKGVDDPRGFLVKIGFTHAAASRILQNTYDSLKFKAIETICLHLNCTPNELLSWKPSAGETDHDKVALNKLKPIDPNDSVVGKLRQLSPEKLEKFREMLSDLEKEE